MSSFFFVRFAAVKNCRKDEILSLKRLGLIYFIYLFIYSGLEFTVTFLMYHKFGYTSIDQAKMFLTTGNVFFLIFSFKYFKESQDLFLILLDFTTLHLFVKKGRF